MSSIRVLCIGDVVGRPGRLALACRLPSLIQELRLDCVLANVENIADGSGITPALYEKVRRSGVTLMSMGDHAFRRKESYPLYERCSDLVRPSNLGDAALGRGWATTTVRGVPLMFLQLQGRQHMKYADCFLREADRLLRDVAPADCRLIFVDFHAESTSEKVAIGWYLDGRVTAVFGTHTHVQTADERILPAGTAFISDVGMTGPHDSILGRKAERVLEHLYTNMPTRFDIADGNVRISGLVVEADVATGKALRVERVSVAVSDRLLNERSEPPEVPMQEPIE